MSPDALQAAVARIWPDLAAARVSLCTMGWDCVALDLDDRVIVKVPRHETAAAALRREARLLAVIGPAVSMPVPRPVLHEGPPLLSRHEKLKGEHLLAAHYARLPEAARDRLAADLALFFAQLHALPAQDMAAAGAVAVTAWAEPEEILRRVRPVLTEPLWRYAERTIGAWQALPPDPFGTVYGFFDGHGWNMAFDHATARLNGIYDFGDSGFGPLHREFIYPDWIAPELTARIVVAYGRLTGRILDRRRIAVLSGTLRLWELAEYAADEHHRPAMLQAVIDWAKREDALTGPAPR